MRNIQLNDMNYSVAKKRIASELMIFPENSFLPTNEELEREKICINLR